MSDDEALEKFTKIIKESESAFFAEHIIQNLHEYREYRPW
jgi:hypothetical protein